MRRSVEPSQYVALRYTERLAGAGALAAIGNVGDSYDNAPAESVIGLYKADGVRPDGPFKTVDELELATLSWVHWWNEQRHSTAPSATSRPSSTSRPTTVRAPPDSSRFSGQLTAH